jgi:hypothetical protein
MYMCAVSTDMAWYRQTFLTYNIFDCHCRTPVVIALCGLFELASDVDTETRHANNVSGQ